MKKYTLPIMLFLVFALFTYSCKKTSGDTNKPFIVMLGFNPTSAAIGTEYIDAGAEAWDVTEAGDTISITDRLQTSDNIDINTEGTYQVKYNVSDEAGNQADEQIRTVKILLGK